jgi:hypothetical protein
MISLPIIIWSMQDSKSLGAVGCWFSARIIRQAAKSAVNWIGTLILRTLSSLVPGTTEPAPVVSENHFGCDGPKAETPAHTKSLRPTPPHVAMVLRSENQLFSLLHKHEQPWRHKRQPLSPGSTTPACPPRKPSLRTYAGMLSRGSWAEASVQPGLGADRRG